MALRLATPKDEQRKLWFLNFSDLYDAPEMLARYNNGKLYAFFKGTEQEGRDAFGFGETQWKRYAAPARPAHRTRLPKGISVRKWEGHRWRAEDTSECVRFDATHCAVCKLNTECPCNGLY